MLEQTGQPLVGADPLVGFPDPSKGIWHVLHTKSRQEKAVADDLAAMGIGHFLPLVRQKKYHGNRKVTVDAPLFPGYVFLRGELDDAYRADRTKRIASIIKVIDQQKLDWELSNLHIALIKQAPLVAFPHLKQGVRVEVRSGPFRGLQGIIEDRLANARIILQVDLLGRAVSMEIEGAVLEVIDD